MTSPAIKIHESDESARGLGQVLCGMWVAPFIQFIITCADSDPEDLHSCQRQTSRYTCPSCNLFYCSLNCFRSESHSQCSEQFYRREIEIGIKSESSKSEGDRNNILDLLIRTEEQSAVDEDADALPHHSDEGNEGDSLVNRFSAVDISSTSADDLLRLLTKKERDKFFYALRDPSSGLAQELLKSAELEKTRRLPWWEAPSDGGESPPIPYGQKPDIMIIPTDLVNQASRGVSLLYNISAVLLSYAYITRHLAISPLSTTSDVQDRRTARSILSRSVPFLADQKSSLLYLSLNDALLSFWSRLDSRSIDNKSMLVLLQDVAKLVRPQRVTETGGSSGEEGLSQDLAAHHPFVMTVMVISDLSSLFSTHLDSAAVVRRRGHIEMKLTFYAAHILSTPSSHMHALADEALLLSRSMGEKALVSD